MIEEEICFYCERTVLQSYKAGEAALAIKLLKALPNPTKYRFGKPICSDCINGIAIKLKELLK